MTTDHAARVRNESGRVRARGNGLSSVIEVNRRGYDSPVIYEPRDAPLLSRAQFFRRQAQHILLGLAALSVSLLLGMAGYHYLESLGWTDAFLNAAMLLGGEGPIEQPRTVEGKLFAGAYALYSGVLFIG